MSLLSTVFAAGSGDINIGPKATAAGVNKVGTIGDLIGAAIGSAFLIAFLLVFVMLVFGGVQWILAGGDKEGTEKARKRITAALIGLAIVFSAYALAFLVEAIFKISILTFTIPTIVP